MSLWKKFQNFMNPTTNEIKTNDNRVNGQKPHVDLMGDFSKVLQADQIEVDCQLSSPNEVLKQLAKMAVMTDPELDVDTIYGKFLLREQANSTNLEDGIAVPHAQDASVKKLTMLIIKLTQPIMWGDKPVQVIIALLIPKYEPHFEHVTCLAAICQRLLRGDFLQKLRAAQTPNEVKNLFTNKN